MKKILLKVLLLSFVLPIMAVPVQVYARAREVPYNHALSRAISRSPVISPLDRDIRQANARARDIMDEYLTVVNVDQFAAYVLYGEWLQEIAARDRLTRERERLVLAVELELIGHLANLSRQRSDIQSLESNLLLQEQMLEHTILRHSHGMASDFDLREAEQALEQTGLNLEMLRLAHQNESQQLNRLIHQPITADIRVIYDIDYSEPEVFALEGTDLERHLRRQAERDHQLMYFQEEVRINHHNWQRFLDAPEVNNDERRLLHRLSVLNRDMEERHAELRVRTAMGDWDRLVERQLALEADLTQAQTNYENMKNLLETGMATQIQVDGLAVALAAQEAQLAQHNYAFWKQRIRVMHPYLR